MAPSFQTTKVVANITVLMNTNEKAMTSISALPGRSKVSPFFGIPLLLSSSMLVGASGRPGFLFDFLSLSLSTSKIWLPILGFDGLGVASVYRLRTRAALSLSLAVNGALFVDSTGSLAVVMELLFVSEQDRTNLLLLESNKLVEPWNKKGQGFNGVA
ncbi:hypothetical protein F2Q69_00015041 [Brassica cretica]|uniref:Uncharacterized protein n=1 Tax=Brassica cretica TaxID=69181 RepID=A0A8S9R925_BRACR|nr:hypothetical protein F2Q69_00015041 [Brassica cretica]